MSDTVLRIENLVKSYGTERAVDGISLDIKGGEFLTLLGPSGCGKSTTLNAVAGFSPHDSGDIHINGKLINDLPPFERDTGMVFQDYALFPHLSVDKNIGFGLAMRKLPPDEIAKRVAHVVSLVKLEGLGARSPSQLSGGQQQRVALARALVIEPTVLLLDEPLSNLDMRLREEMRIEIIAIQKKVRITTLFVTHDQGEALAMSDRIAVMNKGRIEQVGTPIEIYEHPKTKFVAEFIGKTNFFHGTIVERHGTKDIGLFRSDRDIEFWVQLSDGVGPGTEVNISLRPEKCTLKSSIPDAQDNVSVKCRVEQVIYLGSKRAFVLDFDRDQHGLVEIQNDGQASEFADGDEVYLCANRSDCLVLPTKR
jgi:spermidine/putrescine ABC transporter ATP-binding subunit